ALRPRPPARARAGALRPGQSTLVDVLELVDEVEAVLGLLLRSGQRAARGQALHRGDVGVEARRHAPPAGTHKAGPQFLPRAVEALDGGAHGRAVARPGLELGLVVEVVERGDRRRDPAAVQREE